LKGGHPEFCIPVAARKVPVQSNIGENNLAATEPNGCEKDDCVICHLPQDKFTRRLPCDHLFHDDCLMSHMKYGVNKLCPICRAEMPSIEEIVYLPAPYSSRLYIALVTYKYHSNFYDIFRTLLDQNDYDIECLDDTNEIKFSPLKIAACFGRGGRTTDTEVISLLLQKGAKV